MSPHHAVSADDGGGNNIKDDHDPLDDAVLGFFRAEGTHRASGDVKRVANAMTKAVADADAAQAALSGQPDENGTSSR